MGIVQRKPKIRFNRAEHRYWIDDIEAPGVNRILRHAGLVDESYFTEEISQRGRYVAESIALINRKNLARDSVDPEIAGYLAAYDALVNDERFEILSSEEIIANERDWYAGTIDLTIRFRRNDRIRYGVLELKTGMAAPWHRLQVEAYRRAKPRPRGQFWHPYLAYLQQDGTHSGLVPCEEWVESWQTFTWALGVFQWRVKHGDRTAFSDRTAADHVSAYREG